MEFVLNGYHRNISDEELSADIVRVAEMLQKTTVTAKEYSSYGKYHSRTQTNRFGSWSGALERAGLKSQSRCCPSLQAFADDLIRVAGLLGANTVTCTEYKSLGIYNCNYPHQTHGLSWSDVLSAAHLEQTPFHHGRNKNITDRALLKEIERIWNNSGRQPTIADLKNGHSRYGVNTYLRRFGSWRGTLQAFADYVNSGGMNESGSQDEEDAAEAHSADAALCGPQIHHKTKREPNLRLRMSIMHRDKFKCCLCGRSPATDSSVELVVDHIYPWAKGGETTFDNLQTLCRECNLGKSDSVLECLCNETI